MNWDRVSRLGTSELGKLGEALAVGFLLRRGHRIVERNRECGSGEIDIVAVIESIRTAVEVRSIRLRPGAPWPPAQPLDAFDPDKSKQVVRLARSIGCPRIDLIAVGFHPNGCDLHWVPEIS